MLPQCSHITRKRGVYYYRRRLPQPSTRELTLSLRTRCFREAEWLAAKLDEEFRVIMSSVKNEQPADIQRIAREYLRGALEHDLSVRQRQAGTALTPSGRWHASVAFAADELDKAKEELAGRGHPQRHADLVDWLMDKHGVPQDQRQELFFAILRVHVAQWETIKHRAVGDFSYQPEELNGELQDLTEAPAVPQGTTTTLSTAIQVPPSAPLLSKALPNFIALTSRLEKWNGQTLAQSKTTYRMFLECCGDLPVTEYGLTHCARFYNLLLALPKLYSKSAAWRGMSPAEIAAKTKDEDHERLNIRTVKRHFAALGRLFNHLRQHGEYVGENPAYGFDFSTKGRAKNKRKMWQGDALTKLFSSPVWTGCFSEDHRSRPGEFVIRDEKYWLPLLGLYHGNRLEEFAQLHRADVRQEEGIWFLDINDEADKRVKNEQSKRRVPIHPELLRLGFLYYVATTAPNQTDRVFPLLRPGGPDHKLGFYFTKWWSRYRKDVGVYEKGLDYHSFRGGVTTKLTEAGVYLEVRNELLGHEGKSTDERSYQKGFTLKFLAEAIGKVSWPEVHLESPDGGQIDAAGCR